MICNKCGNEVSEESKFCPVCGCAAETEENETNVQTSKEEASFADAMEEAGAQINTAAVPETEAEAAKETATESVPAAEEKAEENYKPVQPVKKSNKGLIIGASAAGAVAVAAAVGYFGFSNEIMHLFMGDAGFAGMIEEKSVEYICGNEVDTQKVDEAVAAYIEQMCYGEETPLANASEDTLDKVLSAYGDTSVTFRTEFDPGMLISLVDSEGMISNLLNIEAVLESVNGDDCDRFSYMLGDEGERIVGLDVFLKDNTVATLIPELTSEVFTVDINELTADDEEAETEEVKEKVEFSETEAKRIREKLVEIYRTELSESEIEYTKEGTDLVIADCPIDSERVIIRASDENINTMLKDMGDFLRNDEYIRNYYTEATGKEISEYEAIFDEAKYDFAGNVVIETYITDHAKVTGKKITLTETDSETEDEFSMIFETTDKNFDVVIGNAELTFKVTGRDNGDGSGNIEIAADGTDMSAPLVLAVDYSGVGTAEYRGETINVGKYSLYVSEKDEFFDYAMSSASQADEYSSDMSSDFGMGSGMDLSSVIGMLKDMKIEVSTECDGNSINSYLSLDIPMLFDIKFIADVKPLEAEKPVMPDCSNAIDLSDESALEGREDLMQEMMDKLKSLAEKSELIKTFIQLAEI